MAIYHFNVSMVSRGKGHNVIAKASYINASKMENRETGEISNYTSKSDVIFTEISLPPHAPKEFSNSENLWNSVLEIEKAKNSQLARRGDFALPKELTKEQGIELAREYINNTFVKNGMCVEWAYHDKQGNPHIDFIATTRPLKENGEWGVKSKKVYDLDENGEKIFQKKDKNGRKIYKNHKEDTTDWNKKETLEYWRSEWANYCNKALERNGHDERIDHRSYERQGKEQVPTIHEGVHARGMQERLREKGMNFTASRCQNNINIKKSNEEVKAYAKEMSYLREQELITRIQIGYEQYRVLSYMDNANKIIHDSTKSTSKKDMEIAKNYINQAEQGLHNVYAKIDNLPKRFKKKYDKDLESIAMLRAFQDKVYFENFELPKQEQAIEKEEPIKHQESIKQEKIKAKNDTVQKKATEPQFNAKEHAKHMMITLGQYMVARYNYEYALQYNVLELQNGVSHEFRDKLSQLDHYKAKYDDVVNKINTKSDELSKVGTFALRDKKTLKNEIKSLKNDRERYIEKMAEVSRPTYSGLDIDYMRVNQFTQKTGYDESICFFEDKAKVELKKEKAREMLPQFDIAKQKKEEFLALAQEIPERYKETFQQVMKEYSSQFMQNEKIKDTPRAYRVIEKTKKYVLDKMPLSKQQQKEKELNKNHSRSFGRDR